MGDHRGLQHVRENRQDRVEGAKLGHVLGLVLNAGHQLGEDDKIQDQRRGKERVLAGVVHRDGVAAAHEDLRDVLVQSALRILDGWDVLDDDQVVGLLTLLVQDVVSSNHVVDDVRLGDLLGTELLGSRQVLAVVVTEMVVGRDGNGLDTGVDEEVNDDGLDLVWPDLKSSPPT